MHRYLRFLTVEILILVILMMIISIMNHFSRTQYMIEGMESSGIIETGTKGRPVLILVHAEWCGHCKNMMPEWDKFQANHDKNCRKIESAEITEEIREKYGANSYPTIVLIEERDGDEIFLEKYNGERTEKGFTEFLQQYLV